MQFDKFKKESDSMPVEIVSCENYLQSVCEEYDICYETCEFNHPDKHIVQEGIIGSIWKFIKNIFAGVIKVLVAIWKLIVSVVKKIWNGLKALYRFIFGKKEQTKTKSEKKVKVSILESSAPINEKTFVTNDINQIKAAYERSIKSISAKIDKLSRENIEFMKKIEKDNTTAVKESVNFNMDFSEDAGKDASIIALDKLKSNKIYGSVIDDSNIKSDNTIDGSVNTGNYYDKDTLDFGDDNDNQYMQGVTNDTITYGESLVSYYGFSNLDISNSAAYEMVIECQGGIKEIYDELVNGALLSVDRTIVDRMNEVENVITDEICSKFASVHPNVDKYDVKRFIVTTFGQLSQELLSLNNNIARAMEITSNIASFPFDPTGVSKDNLSTYYEIFNEFLVNKYFPPFYKIEDEKDRIEVIKAWCQSKIDYNKALIESLKKILKMNEMVMGFSSREIISDIDNGDFNSTRNILSNYIYKNIRYDSDHIIIDGTKDGMGIVIMNPSVTEDKNFRKLKYLDPKVSDEIINFLAYYDLSVHGHGANLFLASQFRLNFINSPYPYDYMIDPVKLYEAYKNGKLSDYDYENRLEETVANANALGELDKLGMTLSVNDSPEKIKMICDTVFSSTSYIDKNNLAKSRMMQYLKDKTGIFKQNGSYGKTVTATASIWGAKLPLYSVWFTFPTLTPDRKHKFFNLFSYLYYVTHFDSTREFKKILVGSCNPEGGNAPNWMYESDVEFSISARSRLS